ncbi:MAG: T9SS type A sorting domain-containing protein [Ignavibacteria bacterium]|nr:T9SS type A sorting domain-containing protein [Ignavibacteria bacterium]
MKNFLLIFLLSLSFSTGINEVYSWDSEAAKFFPLAVGNQWSYNLISRGGNPIPCYPNNQYNYIITITGDTVFNGHKYYKFSNGDRLRIDSVSMNVYKFLGQGECMIDSLLAKKNNQVNSCKLAGVITDTSLVLFAGENRRATKIQGIGYSRRLLYGIGEYYYGGCELGSGFDQQLNGCIINGVQYGQMLGLNNISNELPSHFTLFQNYPNPFNPATKIKFAVSGTSAAQTTLAVYNVLGHEVSVLVNQQLQPGTYEADWDASAYPSGVYYYKLESGSFTETKKMVLIK